MEEIETYDLRTEIGTNLKALIEKQREEQPGTKEYDIITKDIAELTRLLQDYDRMDIESYHKEQQRELEERENEARLNNELDIQTAKMEKDERLELEKLNNDKAVRDAETEIKAKQAKTDKMAKIGDVAVKGLNVLAWVGMFVLGMNWEQNGHTFRSKMFPGSKPPKL